MFSELRFLFHLLQGNLVEALQIFQSSSSSLHQQLFNSLSQTIQPYHLVDGWSQLHQKIPPPDRLITLSSFLLLLLTTRHFPVFRSATSFSYCSPTDVQKLQVLKEIVSVTTQPKESSACSVDSFPSAQGDEELSRIRKLVLSLKPSAKSNLQVAAEYLSIGKLGK